MSDESVERIVVRPRRGSVDNDAPGLHTAGTDRQRHGPTADGDAGDEWMTRALGGAAVPAGLLGSGAGAASGGPLERERSRSRKTFPIDRGRIRYTFFVDTQGNADLDNDLFRGFEEPDAGPHPVFVGDADFCDLLTRFAEAPSLGLRR
jgi:hypothetical protein